MIASLGLSFAMQGQVKSPNQEVSKPVSGSVSKETRKQLNLTYEQQTPHREIIKRYAELAREVRKSALKPEDKKAKLELLNMQREAEIKTLLTPEQYKIHLELAELRKSQMVDMRKKASPGSVNAK